MILMSENQEKKLLKTSKYFTRLPDIKIVFKIITQMIKGKVNLQR